MSYDIAYKLCSKVDLGSKTYNLKNFNITEYSTLVYAYLLVDEGSNSGGEGNDSEDKEKCGDEDYLGGCRLQKNISSGDRCGTM